MYASRSLYVCMCVCMCVCVVIEMNALLFDQLLRARGVRQTARVGRVGMVRVAVLVMRL